MLPVEFFNKLLQYRSHCEESIEQGQSYADWYARNFGRSHEIAASCQQNLQECFPQGETRVLDLFMDLPKEQENKYLTAHFHKLDMDMANIVKASKTTDVLTNSITFMETLRRLEENKKALRKYAILGGDGRQAQP